MGPDKASVGSRKRIDFDLILPIGRLAGTPPRARWLLSDLDGGSLESARGCRGCDFFVLVKGRLSAQVLRGIPYE